MLLAKNRLNLSEFSKKDFKGKKIQADDFVTIGRHQEGIFKLAISVSRKVAKRAVDRNRIKRIISEALKNQNIFAGELLIIVKKNLANLKTQEVRFKLEKILKKL